MICERLNRRFDSIDILHNKVAALLVYVSDESAFVTGQTIMVHRGWSNG